MCLEVLVRSWGSPGASSVPWPSCSASGKVQFLLLCSWSQNRLENGVFFNDVLIYPSGHTVAAAGFPLSAQGRSTADLPVHFLGALPAFSCLPPQPTW